GMCRGLIVAPEPLDQLEHPPGVPDLIQFAECCNRVIPVALDEAVDRPRLGQVRLHGYRGEAVLFDSVADDAMLELEHLVSAMRRLAEGHYPRAGHELVEECQIVHP